MPKIFVQDLRPEQTVSSSDADRPTPRCGGRAIRQGWVCGRIEAGKSGNGDRGQSVEDESFDSDLRKITRVSHR